MLNRLEKAMDWERIFRAKKEDSHHSLLASFYAKGLPNKDTPIEDIEFLAMDFETTGLDPAKDDIISIGIVPFQLNRVYLSQSFQWTISPRKQLNESSVVIHGITHSDLEKAPDMSEIIDALLSRMAGKVIVVHYNPIEREFLDKAIKERIGEGIVFPVIDTMYLENLIRKRFRNRLLDWLFGGSTESVRLGQSRERYGLPTYTPHHALTDAIATAELLQAQMAYHFDPKSPVKDFWI